jgi:F0F1-type ATP synthase assembly protein I
MRCASGGTPVGHPPPKDPDALARGYVWASRVTTIALQAVIPAGLGYWLDQRWGTFPWLLVIGAGLGLAIMLRELIRLTTPPASPGSGRSSQR